ncbi:MAG: zinc ribbon domain-containing protein [Bacteroidales bacterium]|nr:zinc ribbon domain-containing protein [Bacteroidales bacterium]
MKYCPNCGAQLPDNANFCSVCGARFGAPQPNYQQPQYQQPQYQQPQYQQPQQPQKMSYWDKVKAAQKKQKIKWWMWALIGVGTYLLIQLNPLGLS